MLACVCVNARARVCVCVNARARVMRVCVCVSMRVCVCVSMRVYRSEYENRNQTHGKLKWYIA